MDKSNKELFRKNLIFLDLEFEDKYDFFRKISDELYKKGVVYKTFKKGLMEREDNYPTGLPTIPYAIAIPHCDPIHVIEETISIIRFKDTLIFNEMGQNNKPIACKFAFVLTIKEIKQVSILSDLMQLFQNEDFINKLVIANNDEVISMIDNL